MMHSADDLLLSMYFDVYQDAQPRVVSDDDSPRRGPTTECCFMQWHLSSVEHNKASVFPFDEAWAMAYVLHFFTGSEEAHQLRKFNKNADRFLQGDKWVGAYGSIGMPQLWAAIDRLKSDRYSRRAIITLTATDHFVHSDLNVPSCPTSLHLLFYRGALHLGIYQRSLNLVGVGPYDLLLFTHVLAFAAEELDVPKGGIHWSIGSCHVAGSFELSPSRHGKLWIDHEALLAAPEVLATL
jgi:hypothetical protein